MAQFFAGVAHQWIENRGDGVFGDGYSEIVHGKTNGERLAFEGHDYVAFVRTMLQGVADQVLQHLGDAPRIPVTTSVAQHLQRRIALRIARTGFGNRRVCCFGHVHGRRFDRQAPPQAAAYQFQ